MIPRIGLLTPVKAALGAWLVDFRDQFQPDTPANAEWASRDAKAAMIFAPARMVDQVESMLSSWARNDNTGRAGSSGFSPVLFVAVAPDYTPTPGEAGRPMTDKLPIGFEDDTLRRSFRLRTISAEIRAQVVVVCSDILSASSIIGQLDLWATERQRFKAAYPFAGFSTEWPVVVQQGDRLGSATPVGEQMAILTLDLTMRATMPMFYGPAAGEPNDGNDPPGYPVVQDVTTQQFEVLGRPTDVDDDEWLAYLRSLRAATSSQVVLAPVREVQHA